MATYTAAVFVGAGLVFLVEPMIAKMVLPVFGGASAVWITALVFFQVVLLCGYGYAHLSHRLLGRRQPLLHAVVLGLGLVALPIALPSNAAPSPHTAPALWLLVVLTVAVGGPFFVVTAASPTLQRWFAHSAHPRAHDPYFLYAASNAGSLLALVAYPLLVEPNLTLNQQTRLWQGGYVVFCGLCAACSIVSAGSGGSIVGGDAQRAASSTLAWRRRLWWIALAFVPASLLVGATSYLSTDIAPIPLLWVVPLGMYLLTFVIAFSRRPLVAPATAACLLPLVVVAFALSVPGLFTTPVWVAIVVQPAIVLVAGLLAHGMLAAQRPAAEHLTEFFLLLALGGVLGSVFAALIAPLLFSSLIEYPLVIGLALLLRAPGRAERSTLAQTLRDAAIGCGALMVPLIVANAAGVPIRLGLAACAVGALVFYRRPVSFACGITMLCVLLVGKTGLVVERTFYGVLIVRDAPGHLHILNNGTTIHGLEWYDGRRGDQPLGYYTRTGPVG